MYNACLLYTSLRKDAFKKIQTFSFSEIDRFSTGSLVTRLTNDITQVQNLIMMALRMMLRAPGMLIGAIIMAFLMDRELAAVFLIVLPVMTVVILLLLRIAYPRFEFMQKKLDALNSNIQEVLTNVRAVSYTHLDVYKRQPDRNLLTPGIKFEISVIRKRKG